MSAALDIVGTESLDALTMARVAEAVELTAGALYRYFDGKDALVAAMQARTIARIQQLFESQRETWLPYLPPTPPVAALAELAAAADFYLELARHEPRTFRLIAATFGDPRPLVADAHAQRVIEPLTELLERVSRLFAAAASVGALEPGSAALRTIVFWTALHGVVSSSKLDRLAGAGWFEGARLAAELTRSLLRGWGAAPELVELAMFWLSSTWPTHKNAQHPTPWEVQTS